MTKKQLSSSYFSLDSDSVFQQTAEGRRLKKKDQSDGRSRWFFLDFPGAEDTAHYTMSNERKLQK